jgi:hypothetical protein
VAVLGAIVFLVACNDDDPATSAPESQSAPSRTPTETPAAPSTPDPTTRPESPRCSNQEAAIADPELVRPDSLSGDVDGDARTDDVRLVVDPGGRPGCQAFVGVATETGLLAAPFEEDDLLFDLGLPALERLVPVDNNAGDEILVRVRSGASTQFYGLFTATDGQLHRVLVKKGAGTTVVPDFASGGSVGHLDAVDCANDRVVVTSAVLGGDRYKVERSFYLPGPVLREENRERKRVRAKELNRFPEFAGSPFGSCVLP